MSYTGRTSFHGRSPYFKALSTIWQTKCHGKVFLLEDVPMIDDVQSDRFSCLIKCMAERLE